MNNDEKFENLLRYSVGLASEELVEEYDTDEKTEFSEQHRKKMDSFFEKVKRNERKKRLIIYSKRAAMFLVIILSVASISVMSVRAWRVKFLNFVMQITETNTEIKYEDNKNHETYASDEISLNYIPDGFKLTDKRATENSLMLNFEKDDYFFRLRIKKDQSIKNIDTENSEWERIKINENEGFFNYKNEEITINWSDSDFSYTYSLMGNLDKESMIKIAQNIEK